jgi:multiple sugar transport system substrate-binding protein
MRLNVLAMWSLVAALGADTAPAEPCKRLLVLIHPGPVCEALRAAAQPYTEKTGIEIEIATVPYGGQWHEAIAAEFATHGAGGFDLMFWDSEMAPEFASQRNIVPLNDRLAQSRLIKLADFDQRYLHFYSEYPEGSGQIWALPINLDTVCLMYRKDLFENPAEQAAFRHKYGYALQVPDTYQQARDIAEFFTRPQQGLFGWAQMGGREYDFASTAANCFLWSYGGELWNPQTREVRGFVDAPASADGLKMYLKLFDYGPPGCTNWGWNEVNQAFQQGRVAMIQQWYYFCQMNTDPKNSTVAAHVGFANLPGAFGRDGKFRRQYSLGGQGLGISKYSKHIEEAWAFLEWFYTYGPQWEFAKTAPSARLDILRDPRWLQQKPWYPAFSVAMSCVNDYWVTPEYMGLLAIWQDELVAMIARIKTVEQALADTAQRQEALLVAKGYQIRRTPRIPAVVDGLVAPCGREHIYQAGE